MNDLSSPNHVEELVLHLRTLRTKTFTADGKKRAIADATLSYDPEEKGKRNIETEPFIFEAPIGPIEKDDLRWYLERYSTWPTGVFKQRAENIVKHLPIWGKALYDQIFLKVPAFDVLMAWKSSTGKRRFTVYVNSMLAAGAKKNKKKQMEANEAASELLSLPWELLHDGSGYLFQGAKPVQVRRQLPNTKVLDAAVWDLPVRILLVSPRPGEEYVSYIDHRVTAMPMVEAVEKLGGLAELTVLTPATFPRLEEELNGAQQYGKPYHAVHFDGHGVFSPKVGLGGLCFEDHEDSKKIENRRCEIIDAKELAGMIKDHRIPLFFLEACQSAKSEEDPTASVAAALLKEGAASVVAMSHTVLVETTRRFVQAFYKELTKGSRVGDAMVAGHRELYAKRDRGTIFGAGKLEMQDWFVPVLYQEKEDAALLKTPNQKLLEVQEPFLEKVPGLLNPYRELPDVPGHGFIGRSRELLKMERMLEQKRYMVICGQGGEGKTAIACELSRWLVRTGRYDRVVFVSVEHIYNVRAVVDGVGRQLVENYSVAQYPDTELLKGALEPIEKVLREKRVLVILDNMESILPAVGNESGDLSGYAVQMEPGELEVFFQLCKKLNGVGKTGLVFTSREGLPKPMDSQGNHLELGRLSKRDAVELVKEVMGSEGIFPKEEEKGGTAGNIEALVEAVDCHARSLVLMAPYIGEWGLKETQENLEKLMEELHRKYPGDRERSVFACVEMSLRRLSPWVRERIKGLGVFKGGGNISSIQFVFELDKKKRDQLVEELVQTRLVTKLSYGFLRFHPALAPYLRQEMTDEEFQQTTARWVESMKQMTYFLYEQQFKDAQLSSTLTQMELSNLVSLLEYTKNQGNSEQTIALATRLEQLISLLGRPRLLARVAAIRESESEKLKEWGRARFESLKTQIERSMDGGNLQGALNEVQELLALCQKAGESAYPGAAYDTALTYFLFGRILNMRGMSDKAILYIDEAFKRFNPLIHQGNHDALRMASVSLTEKGECLIYLGRLEEAAEAYEEGIAASEKLEDFRTVAVGKGQIGTIRMLQGRLHEALEAHREAKKIFIKLGDLFSAAIAWHQMGMVYEKTGQFEGAENAFCQALALDVKNQNSPGEASSLGELGNLYNKMCRLQEAALFYKQAAEKYMGIEDQAGEGRQRSNLTSTLIQLKRYKEARPEVLRAIECMIPLGHSGLPWLAYNNLYILEKAEGNLEAAAKAREQAFQLFLSYRRAGGENHESGGKLCAWFLQAFSNPGEEPEPIENQLLDLAHTPHQPQVFYQLITKLLAILSGSRDRSLYQDPELDYQAAVELKLILEKVGGEEGLLRNAE